MIEFAVKGSGDLVVPFTKGVVPEIDLVAGFVTVEPPVMIGNPEPAAPPEAETEIESEGRS